MVSITLSVPEEVHELMKKFPEINWSGLVRNCIIEKTKKLAMKEEMLKQMEKERDFIDWSVKLGRKAKEGRVQRLK